jgi:flagellar hook-associated protein 3 FlgL
MLSIINSEAQQFLTSLNSIQTQLNTAEQQVSTGLKVNTPSDAPDEVSPILQLHTNIQQNQNIQNNLNTVQTTVTAAAQALSSSVNLLQNGSVIASEATATDQTAATRATLAQSVEAIQEQMVNNSTTTVNGNFVFSGDQTQTPLYQLDLSAPEGVDRLATATNTNLVQGEGNTQFSASLTANTIFDDTDASGNPTPNNAFAALNDLRTALLNNDTTGINTSISELQTASTYMNNQQAFYGNVQDQITGTLNDLQNNAVQLQTQLSNLQDVNMTSAITDLTQAQTQMQAALAAQARFPQTTLFDVLPAPTS